MKKCNESTCDPDIIVHPVRGKKEQNVPKTGLLLVNSSEANRTVAKLLREEGWDRKRLFHSNLVVSPCHNLFVAGPAIGAPMAVMVMEKLIALGAKRFILCGWCGAIANDRNIGDVVVPESCLPGEGTSQYYPGAGKYFPDAELRRTLYKTMKQVNSVVSSDKVWSTDAIYRESRKMLQRLHYDEGVSVVDMEYSALCAVAHFRKVSFAGVLTVSDLLYSKEWRPGFSSPVFKKNSAAVIDHLLTTFCCSKRVQYEPGR